MAKVARLILICLAASLFFSSFNKNAVIIPSLTIPGITRIEDLDAQQGFSFSIISDNQGANPYQNIYMARMCKWVSESNDQFVLGLGDHVRKNHEDDFIEFLVRNKWWHSNFYPVAGDAENDYFGSGQDDWGSGGAFFKTTDLPKREGVHMRKNQAEYYSKIQVNGYTIHFIALHYPDEPNDPEVGFPLDSRDFLAKTVAGIKKGEKDIIIAAAHSRYGFWIDYLSEEQKQIVYGKCDLILSGTTHYFERRVIKGMETSGPLIISAGSVTDAKFGGTNGYIQVHVLENPFAIVTQYISTEEADRELPAANYSYMKYINGKVFPIEFSKSI